tara:strand:- start:11314 stop:11946 length:633 start_codon:yes stop_codon:yes gene_type:complete
MKIVSVIPARGGSKEIPQKNIIDVNGQPLISYTINASIGSNVSETWVSTDSLTIASVAENYGAKVIHRPIELSGDIIMPDAALVHFAENNKFDVLVFIQPTSPLLQSKYINQGLTMMKDYDSVFSAYKEHWSPYWLESGIPIGWDINNRPRRQDKDIRFVENGAFYITTRENLLQSKLRYSGNIGIVEMPLEKSFQVDSENDLKLIKRLI